MNEQILEQHEEQVLTVKVSDEALEAAAGNGLGGIPSFGFCWTDNGRGC